MSYDPAILFLVYNQQKAYIYLPEDMHMNAYTALFITVPNWKLLKCSSIIEQINEMWYIYKVGNYTVIKRNKPKLHATMWMNLTTYKVDKRSQSDTKEYML